MGRPKGEKRKEWKNTNKPSKKHPGYITGTPEYLKHLYLRKVYGIGLDEYKKMMIDQNDSCAICKRHINTYDEWLSVDHCHITGKVRGLLCQPCNRGLGHFRDNIDLMEQARKYLEKHK